MLKTEIEAYIESPDHTKCYHHKGEVIELLFFRSSILVPIFKSRGTQDQNTFSAEQQWDDKSSQYETGKEDGLVICKIFFYAISRLMQVRGQTIYRKCWKRWDNR